MPKANGSLVSTALGSGNLPVCLALASKRSLAMVLPTGANITVNLAALAPSQIPARWFNPPDSSYSADGSVMLANRCSLIFAPPGESVLGKR